jgi:hypothetical protein
MLDTADRQEDQVTELRVNRLRDRLEDFCESDPETSDNGAGGRGCAWPQGFADRRRHDPRDTGPTGTTGQFSVTGGQAIKLI